MTDGPARTLLPPDDPSGLADLEQLSVVLNALPLDGQTPYPAVLTGPDGGRVDLPTPVYEALLEVVRAMRAGRAVTVAPYAMRLTTQQAADLIGISRPTLVRLLEAHEIPFEKPGRHRRVQLADVLAYLDRVSVGRRRALDALTADASAAGLYDTDAAAYRDALEAERRSRPSR